jgi:acyl-CoA thioesterase
LSDPEKISRYIAKKDRYANLAGIELLSASPGYAKAKMVIEEKHLNSADTVHGGAMFTLADFVFAVAANVHGRLALSISSNMFFMQAVKGGCLYAEAQEVSLHHKLATYAVKVTDDANNLVATFEGLVYRKAEGLPQWEQ